MENQDLPSSDTPETNDAHTQRAGENHYAHLVRRQCAMAKIERERDVLAEALRPFTTLNPRSPRVMKFWDIFVENAREALKSLQHPYRSGEKNDETK